MNIPSIRLLLSLFLLLFAIGCGDSEQHVVIPENRLNPDGTIKKATREKATPDEILEAIGGGGKTHRPTGDR